MTNTQHRAVLGHNNESYSDIIALLEKRAALLQPRQDYIESALKKCIAHSATVSAQSPITTESSSTLYKQLDDDSVNSTDNITDHILRTAGQAQQQTVQEILHEDQQLQEHRAVSDRLKEGQQPKTFLQQGSIIQGYRILGLLGKGGMGHVYRALQLSMNREVAFKVLAPRFSRNKNFRTRFLREAHAAGRLHHPHLVAVHDVDETADGMLFFSMELVAGKSIADIIENTGRIEEAEALRLCRQVLDALSCAHKANIVHRDIKPDNIILDLDGSAKVADLGLSRIDDDDHDDTHVTAENTMMGTPYYMSPEQSRDAHNVDHRSDLYALGATLFHMVCGEVPFDGDTPLDVVVSASTEKLIFPDPAPSLAVRRFIEMLMAKNPDDRPETAGHAKRLLDVLSADPKIRMHKRSRASLSLMLGAFIIFAVIVLVILQASSHTVAQNDRTSSHQSNSEHTASQAQTGNLFQAFTTYRGQAPQMDIDQAIFTNEGRATQRAETLLQALADGHRLHSHSQFILSLNAATIRTGDSFRLLFVGTADNTPKNRNNKRKKAFSPVLFINKRGIYVIETRSQMAALRHQNHQNGTPSTALLGHFQKKCRIAIAVRTNEQNTNAKSYTIDITLLNNHDNEVPPEPKTISFTLSAVEHIDIQWKTTSSIQAHLGVHNL